MQLYSHRRLTCNLDQPTQLKKIVNHKIINQMKKLYRSSNRILAGVCGGIAEYFDVDPTLIRVVYVVLSLFTVGFPGLLLYIILMILMPNYDQIEKL